MTNTLSASVSGKSNVLQAQIEDLTERERQLLDALQEVRAGLAKSREALADAERARERIATQSKGRRSDVSEATWRRVVRELGTFTVSELAAELNCKGPTAKRHLDTMIGIGMVAPAGRAMGKNVYTYTKPSDEERAREREQRQRHLAPVPDITITRAQPVAETGRGLAVSNKDVRQACEEAQRRGWKLSKKGDGHFVLTKGAKRVPVAGTPTNGGASADIIRRMTRER